MTGQQVSAPFKSMPEVEEISARGRDQDVVPPGSGINADLRVVSEEVLPLRPDVFYGQQGA